VRISKLSISTTKTTSGSVCSSILEHPAFVEALGLTSCDILWHLVTSYDILWHLVTSCDELHLGRLSEAHVVAFSFKFENQTALQVAEEIWWDLDNAIRGRMCQFDSIGMALSQLWRKNASRARRKSIKIPDFRREVAQMQSRCAEHWTPCMMRREPLFLLRFLLPPRPPMLGVGLAQVWDSQVISQVILLAKIGRYW